jgi:hypothetical protein
VTKADGEIDPRRKITIILSRQYWSESAQLLSRGRWATKFGSTFVADAFRDLRDYRVTSRAFPRRDSRIARVQRMCNA